MERKAIPDGSADDDVRIARRPADSAARRYDLVVIGGVYGIALTFEAARRGYRALHGRRRVEVQRRDRGDLPDWLACKAGLSSLTIAEAKGCHDKAGAHSALKRAWIEAHRINVVSRGRRPTVKRIAIATRWASANGGANTPILSIRDPIDQGEPLSPREIGAALIGVARLLVANLLGPLGYDELVKSLRDLIMARPAAQARGAAAAAQRALDAVPLRHIADEDGFSPADGIVGNLVTRTGLCAASRHQERIKRCCDV